MKVLTTIFSLLFATFTLFAQSVNANFEVDEQGWTSHFTGYPASEESYSRLSVEWSKIIPPFASRGGLSFVGRNYGNPIFLYIQKEVEGLLPNTNYRVMFNMDWIYQMEPETVPIFVKVGALNKEPELTDLCEIVASFDKGKIGQDGRDFKVVGQLTPNEFGYPFRKNLQNYENTLSVDTDAEGRLFLMIGIEPESGDTENVFLNTLRVVLAENGAAQEVSNILPEEESLHQSDLEEETEEQTTQ